MKRQQKKSRKARRLLFVCYGAVLLYVLFARGRALGSPETYWLRVANNYNLDPFYTISNYWDILMRPEYYISKFGSVSAYDQQVRYAVINLAGNVLLFVPMGMFLPAIWRKLQRVWKTMPVVAVIIILLEVAQTLSLRGSGDVDDFILNFIGALFGYLLWRIAHFRYFRRL